MVIVENNSSNITLEQLRASYLIGLDVLGDVGSNSTRAHGSWWTIQSLHTKGIGRDSRHGPGE